MSTDSTEFPSQRYEIFLEAAPTPFGWVYVATVVQEFDYYRFVSTRDETLAFLAICDDSEAAMQVLDALEVGNRAHFKIDTNSQEFIAQSIKAFAETRALNAESN